MPLFNSKREDPREPSRSPRDPRPKGAQKGVARRDNGRRSNYTGARDPDKNAGQGWPFHV